MSLSTLPDLCLFSIFDRIPLLDLLSTVSLVCHRWNNLKPEACHRRTTLTIVQNVHNIKSLEQNVNPYNFVTNPQTGKPHRNLVQVKANIQNCTLILSQLTLLNCERIAVLFPNVKKFSIYQHIDSTPMLVPMIFHINYLLDKWTQTLKTFVFRYENPAQFLHENDFIEKQFSLLFMQINSLDQLEELDLIVLERHGMNLDISPPELTKLKRFAFNGLGFSNTKLLSFGPPGQTKLQDVHLYWYDCDQLFGLPPHTFSSVKSIYLFDEINNEEFDLLCTRFTWLTSLLVHTESRQVTMEPLVKSLTQLPNLMHLTLFLITDILNADTCSVQLPSVKILTLEFPSLTNHQHIERLCVTKIFPNVEVIRVKYHGLNCSVCVNEPFNKEECFTLLIEPLKQYTIVPTIIEQKLGGLDIFDIVEL